jgi:ABC-type multidrug transport system ATPase subunit
VVAGAYLIAAAGYGLLGPNGAGKSTTMRILTGQALADDGSVEVLGHRLPAESKRARARVLAWWLAVWRTRAKLIL